MERHTPRRSAGFTLVELLVVIGIIALLVSMLLPALNKARAAAGAAQCASNMKQIAQAMLNYSIDYKGKLMPARIQAAGISTIYPRGWFWPNEIVRLKYIRSTNQYLPGNSSIGEYTVFQCPQGIQDASFTTGSLALQNALYPADPRNRQANKILTNEEGNLVVSTWYQLNMQPHSNTVESRVGYPNSKARPFVNFNRAVASWPPPDQSLLDPGYTRTLSMIKKSANVPMVFEGSENNLMEYVDVSARHGPKIGALDGYTNIAFFDGHVSMHPTDVWTKQNGFQPPQDGIYVMLADQR